MARVPTWTELRLDATKLIQNQKECNRSVHNLLDSAIPELDRKISILNDHERRKIRPYNPLNGYQSKKLIGQSSKPAQKVARIPRDATYENIKGHDRVKPHMAQHYDHKPDEDDHHYEVIKDDAVIDLERRLSSLNTKSPTTKKYEEPSDKATDTVKPDLNTKTNSKKAEVFTIEFDKHEEKRKHVSIKAQRRPEERPSEKPGAALQTSRPRKIRNSDLEGLEHLKPPPLTPSEYLRLNRPEMVTNADRRVKRLKSSADKRKSISASKTINALEQIRLASRSSSNYRSQKSSLRSVPSRDSMAPTYMAKDKLSEKEMKRLTAKIYNRLPEVKKQRTEQLKKHVQVQNYKNKLEYGRKLLENRRHGVINYPLRTHYDDTSLVGSQDTSMTSSGDRSSDGLPFGSY